MEYDNTNTGVLFKNDKGDNPKRPDYKGSINVNGVDRWLSAWIKDGKNGKFMSLVIGDIKEAQKPKAPDDFVPDETIPF